MTNSPSRYVAEVTIITNHVPRDILYVWDLTIPELIELDLIRSEEDLTEKRKLSSFFQELCDNTDSYVRFKGWIYPLHEFTGWSIGSWISPRPNWAIDWDGYLSDSFFSGIVIKYLPTSHDRYGEAVICGTYYS